MSQPPSENAPAAPTDAQDPSDAAATRTDAAEAAERPKEPTSLPRQHSALALAAMAGVAVPGLDVTRAYDEATQHRDPRVWTAERDRQMWETLEG